MLQFRALSDANLFYSQENFTDLNAFAKILGDYLSKIRAKLAENATAKAIKFSETNIAGNELAQFFRAMGFETQIAQSTNAQSANSAIDLALLQNGSVKVIIEAKLPESLTKAKAQMFSAQNPNCKALCEAILYYLREVVDKQNFGVESIIITDFTRFFIFNYKEFERIFAKNAKIKGIFARFKNDTSNFYAKAQGILDSLDDEICAVCVDLESLGEFGTLKPKSPQHKSLENLYKIFHRDFLFGEFKQSNPLSPRFYNELLYILGLSEYNRSGKILIEPSKESLQGQNTLYHLITTQIDSHNLGDSKDIDFVMQFIILWLNRILFLKLIEANLVRFNNDKNLAFLNKSKLKDYQALSHLFFDVLAKEHSERGDSPLSYLPYLNSSLFEIQPCENLLEISMLDNNAEFIYYPTTQVKKDGKRQVGKVNLLTYIFEFLDAFDFGSGENSDEFTLQKELIKTNVLGLVFEKLNGYKEGSFYTPNFITSYMCNLSLEKIVVEKFNNANPKWNATNLSDLAILIRDERERKDEFKAILRGIRICDPAVGSGHFLVSALCEMVRIYHYLRLSDELNEYELKIDNDEIIVYIESDKVFEYKKPTKPNDNSQSIQKSLFHLKKSIIENNLFGVDINPNSVEICKLRLWIELLKNSYYLRDSDNGFSANLSESIHQMQTLPNIDINIKCGNSLISRFDLHDSLNHIPNIAHRIAEYKKLVFDYKNADQAILKVHKSDIEAKIAHIKKSFNLVLKDPKTKIVLEKAIEKHITLYGLDLLDNTNILAGLNGGFRKLFDNKMSLSETEQESALESYANIMKLRKKLDFALSGKEYEGALEWRFEFPEVLDSEGDFMGFDLIIGNPPYIKEADNKRLFENTKKLRTYQGKMDIWYHFVGKGFDLVKNQGIATFIATNNWTTNAGAQRLRNVILNESQILNLVDFGSYMCFDSASIQTMIMEFRKSNAIPKSYTINYAKIESKKPTDEHRKAVLKREIFDDNIYLTPTITPKKLLDKTLSFVDSDKDLVLNKIIKSGKFYLQKNEVWQGLVHPQPTLDKAIVENLKEQNQIYSVGDGVFNLNIDEIKGLALSKKEKDLLKPYYESNHLLKYYGIKQTNIYVIYTDSSFKKPNSMDKYPNLKSHLDKFQSIITSDNKPYGLHRARKQNIFEGNKILSRVKCVDCPIFTYVDFDCYVGLNFNIIKTSRIDMKYLVGILNSKLVAFWLKHKGKMQGNNYQINQEPLLNIPIVKPNAKNKKIADEIVNLVDKILELKAQDSSANTAPLESQIDKIVFELYALTKDEIKIIESK